MDVEPIQERKMTRQYRTWRESEVARLKAHPEEIQLYLDVAFEEAALDGNWGAFMAAVRTVAEVRGGIGQLADRLGCSRPNLYKTLSSSGNPRLDKLGAILQALDLRLSIQPASTAHILPGTSPPSGP
jgi:probable addiction module antidote protein